MEKPLCVFCWHADTDELLIIELEKWLRPFQHRKLIIVHTPKDIDAGANREQSINQFLNRAHIILLLVSPDFIATDFYAREEMNRVLERHKKGDVCIIPIILRPSVLQFTPFHQISSLPTNAKPITMWDNRDQAFLDVANGIGEVIKKLLGEGAEIPLLPDLMQRELRQDIDTLLLRNVSQVPNLTDIQESPLVTFRLPTKIVKDTQRRRVASHTHATLLAGRNYRSLRIWGTLSIVLVLLVIASFSLNKLFSGSTQQPATINIMASATAENLIHRSISEFPIPTSKSHPSSIISGPDDNLWFVEKDGNKIGYITSQGDITEFPISTRNSGPSGIVLGSDGNLWFHQYRSTQIGRVTPQGKITEFPVTPGSNLVGIAAGPDHNIWFTEFDANKIGCMNTSGVITGEFTVPTDNSGPGAITTGPDGKIWFVEDRANKIGRITPQGKISEFPIPTPPLPGNSNNHGIAPGPDGNVWFTEDWQNKIGKITSQGKISEYSLPTLNSYPLSSTAGPDGNIWFSEADANKIGRITPAGMFLTEIDIPTSNSDLAAITVGPDKNIWFTEAGSNIIGRITTGFS